MPDIDIFALKRRINEYCLEVIQLKVLKVKNDLDEVVHSTQNETKSSAGDKYETGRAMLQIEQDNIRKRLKQALEQKSIFEKIRIDTNTSTIQPGCLVKTNKGYFYISIALGKLEVDAFSFIAISPQSPLGSSVMGLKIGMITTINSTSYTIENIY